jgi:hypothetical protein
MMLSRRKSLMAATAVTATLAAAIPAASANAATPLVDPTVCQLLDLVKGPFGPTAGVGGSSLADVLGRAGTSVGCSSGSQPSFPSFPSLPSFPSFPPKN